MNITPIPAVLLVFVIIAVDSKTKLILESDKGEYAIGSSANISAYLKHSINQATEVIFSCQGDKCKSIIFCKANTTCFSGIIEPESDSHLFYETKVSAAGQLIIFSKTNQSSLVGVESAFINISIRRSSSLSVISHIVGWIYIVSWSVSFYPQIWSNYRRKSVIGLNFDFVGLNLTGFLAYSIFNISLFFIPNFQKEYLERNPQTRIPVELNDVVFSCHATFSILVTVIQCFIYDRGNQRISKYSITLLLNAWIVSIILLILVNVDRLEGLDYAYFLSYVKLIITIIKYIPQTWLNYKRKSTTGWSIGNVLLDFTGGSFSLLQMFITAFNYDEWLNIFGNPTKLGLGLISIVFDFLFMFQHYYLYRHSVEESAHLI